MSTYLFQFQTRGKAYDPEQADVRSDEEAASLALRSTGEFIRDLDLLCAVPQSCTLTVQASDGRPVCTLSFDYDPQFLEPSTPNGDQRPA